MSIWQRPITSKIKTYKEPRWVALRKRILYRDKFIDQYWKRYGKFKTADIVHHIFPVKDFPEYQFAEWNLISVAKSTHNMFHNQNTDELTDLGKELLVWTARRNNVEVPAWYVKPKEKGKNYRYFRNG